MLAVAASALLLAWWTGVASAASAGLEICKAGDNGAAGQQFFFDVSKGTTAVATHLEVDGGGCTTVPNAPNGNLKITEDLTSGDWMVTGINLLAGGPIVRSNLTAGTVTVTVNTTGSETQMQYVNAPISGTVKVCKITNTASFLNKQYSFTINGTPVTAWSGTIAGQPGSAATPSRCSRARRSTSPRR